MATVCPATQRFPRLNVSPDQRQRHLQPVYLRGVRRIIDVPVEVARRYDAGERPTDLADEFGVTVRTVRRWLRETGLLTPGPRVDAAEVAAAYATGESLAAITLRFGIDDKTVLRIVRTAGLPMRHPRLTDRDRRRILERHAAGVTASRIAAELDVARSTVYRALSGTRDQVRRRGSPTRSKA